MKKFVFAGIAAALLAGVSMTSAEAQGGCGPYAHRGWDGFCHSGGGWARPVGFGYGYGPGWHRPGYGWRRPGYGFYRHW